MWHRCPYRLRTGFRQRGLKRPDLVDVYKAQMLAGEWDYSGRGNTFIYWRQDRMVWVGEGHHRANAALEIGRETGDWSYLHRLLEFGRCDPGMPPSADRRPFPARSWLCWWLLILGW